MVTTLVAATLSAVVAIGLVAPPAQSAPPKGLNAKQAAQTHPTLRVGQRDKAVKYLKRQFGMPGKTPQYGKGLKRRVVRFERSQGMRFDRGKVTPATWRALGVPFSRAAAQERARAEQQTRRTSRSTSRASAVLHEAARHAGKPYAYGASGPHAFDCSGFTQYVHSRVGISLPRTAAQQRSAVRPISRSQARPGDLVFVHSGSYVSHVAIYAGGNMWWEAATFGIPVSMRSIWSSSISFGRP